VTFFLLQKYGKLGGLLRWLAGRWPRNAKLQSLAARFTQVDDALRSFHREHPGNLLRAVCWHLVGFSVGILQTRLFLHLLNLQTSWSIAAGVWFLSMWFDLLTFAVPLNLGTLEGSRIVVFKAFGYSTLPGMTFGLALRLAQMFWSLVGLVIYGWLTARENNLVEKLQSGPESRENKPTQFKNKRSTVKTKTALMLFSLTMTALVTLTMTGCSTVKRTPHDEAYLLQLRAEAEQAYDTNTRQRFIEFLEHNKAQNDAYLAGKRNHPPVLDILIISGGGDWGAFGAGYLKGWGIIPQSDPMHRPTFDVVTGVSTGALIAPFAFIDTDEAINTIEQLYRNPKKDWVKQRWPLYFLPSHISFAEVPGLERDVKTNVTPALVAQIAAEGKQGKLLVVNTTCLDDASPRVFNLTAEAERATETGDLSRIYNIMLASAGIPGAFPYREIDGEMYVDGGVTGNIIYGGRIGEEDSLPAVWQKLYPGVPIPKMRFWVIFNNQMHAPPEVVRARWPDIISRAVLLSTRSATITGLRHLYAMEEISHLKRNADVEVRYVAIPDDWKPPVPGTFAKETMNNLADLGEKMGADPSTWKAEPPPP
jgi:hypothetical protein